eukprot:Awhi_evm2s15018
MHSEGLKLEFKARPGRPGSRPVGGRVFTYPGQARRESGNPTFTLARGSRCKVIKEEDEPVKRAVQTESSIGVKRYKADDDVVFITETTMEERISAECVDILTDYYNLPTCDENCCPLQGGVKR